MEASNSSADELRINKQKLMDAVQNDDIKTAKQLIRDGAHINFILGSRSPLHAALELESIGMLELLLSQPNIDLNISNARISAPLLWSLGSCNSYCHGVQGKVPEKFVLRLIQAGGNINMSTNCCEETVLQLSIKYGTKTITNELLKRGADVNYGTALHYAVKRNDLELVCMLLYYNADVYIKFEGHTAFSYALYFNRLEIVEVLNNYYDFSHDDDINYVFNSNVLCDRIFHSMTAEQFKAVWPKFDSEIILTLNPTFIDLYLSNWCISHSTSEWVECLYLILNSDIAFDLIERYRLSTGDSFLQTLLKCMFKICVQPKDWLGIIYMVLGLGFEVTIDDINSAVTYGLNQDPEPFIYGTYSSITYGSKFVCPLHAFVIGMQTDYSVKKISQIFHDASEELQKYIVVSHRYAFREYVLNEMIAMSVTYFSFPADVKISIMRLNGLRDYIAMIGKRLREIPEFPSLTELSRNQIHKYLVQKFKFKQPYQLQNFVKKLLIPNKIQNIILFKEPIY